MKSLVIIPARGGSKRLPHKNLFPICGKPLIAHTIEQALEADTIGHVIVSSDSDEILLTARSYGQRVLALQRPKALATDEATTESVMEHILLGMREQPEVVVLLQCTSPVREPQDIDYAVRMVTEQGYDSVLSVVFSDRFMWTAQAVPINYDPCMRPRSQVFSGQYMENGSIYVFKTQGLLDTHSRLFGKIGLYKMGKGEAFEIDTAFDAFLCEMVMSRWKYAPERIRWFQDKGPEEQWMDFRTYQLATE